MKLIKRGFACLILTIFFILIISTLLSFIFLLFPDLKISSNLFTKVVVLFYKPRFILSISFLYILFMLYNNPKQILSFNLFEREDAGWHIIASLILGFYLWRKLLLSVGPFSLLLLIVISYIFVTYSIELISYVINNIFKLLKK